MPRQADIFAAIDRYKALNQYAEQKEIRDYSTLQTAAISRNLDMMLEELTRLAEMKNESLEASFDALLQKQWRLTRGTAAATISCNHTG